MASRTISVTRTYSNGSVQTRTKNITVNLPANPLMGVSNSDEDHGGYSSWDGWRVYALGDVAGRLSKGAKYIGLTGDRSAGSQWPTISVGGGATSANNLHAFLLDLYGAEGAPTKNQNLKVDWIHGNEQDRNTPGASYFTTYDLCHAVTDLFNNVRIGYDATHYNVQQGVTQNQYGQLAGKVEVFMASLYNPGRDDTPHPTYKAYSVYCDDVMDLAQAWGAKHFVIGECGSPIADADSQGHIDYTLRPAYFAGGTTAGSLLYPAKTWGGLLQYVYDGCLARGMTLDACLYWDQDIDVANPFWHDEGLVVPDTATAWRTWTP